MQALFDGGAPGGVAVWADRALGAQNGNAAHNAQARIKGMPGDFGALRHADDHGQRRAGAASGNRARGLTAQGEAKLLPGHGINGRCAHGQGQARQSHAAHAGAALDARKIGIVRCQKRFFAIAQQYAGRDQRA